MFKENNKYNLFSLLNSYNVQKLTNYREKSKSTIYLNIYNFTHTHNYSKSEI